MYITRIAKIVMVASLAVYCLLVVFGNLTDYQSNFLFVQHVMSMDTTFPGNRLMYRAITNPALWHAAYAVIIAGEALAGVLLLAGAIRLFQARQAPGAAFDGAKNWTVAGVLVAFLVWFFIFEVVAGEWFAMWQSATWNGQEAAFRIYISMLAVLIFVLLPDKDLEEAAPDKAAAKTAAKAAKKTPAKRKAPAKKKAHSPKSVPAKTSSAAKKRTRAKTSAAASRLAAANEKIQEEG